MTRWEEFHFEEHIRQILEETTYVREGHHLGRPFLTPYQIAIEYADRHPADFARIGVPIGGRDTGQRNSLSQYIAGQLSQKILSGDLPDFEGGFLSNNHLLEFTFDYHGEIVESSLTNSPSDLSIFRLRV